MLFQDDIRDLQQGSALSFINARLEFEMTTPHDVNEHWAFYMKHHARKSRLARQMMGITDTDQLYS